MSIVIYRISARNLMKESDRRILDRPIYYQDHFRPPQPTAPIRFTQGMFELHHPEKRVPFPGIALIYDDHGPFAACGVFPEIDSYQKYSREPRGYWGNSKHIDPLVVRSSLFRFPQTECDQHSEFFWGLRLPNPFDRRENFLRYLIKFHETNSDLFGTSSEGLLKMYGELIEQADKDDLRVARSWPQQCQGSVLTACAENGIRARQLFQSFPLLAWLIYVRSDVFTWQIDSQQNLNSRLKKMVNDGRPLKDLAYASGIPLRTRKLDPKFLCEFRISTRRDRLSADCGLLTAHNTFYQSTWMRLPNYCDPAVFEPPWREPAVPEKPQGGILERITKMIDIEPIPDDEWRRIIWNEACWKQLGFKELMWLYKMILTGDEKRITVFRNTLGDWMTRARGPLRWTEELQWDEALDRSEEWHEIQAETARRLRIERQKRREEEESKPFPEPWFEPWEDEEGEGCSISFISDRDELVAHGAEQKNCVGTYAISIINGGKQIYKATFGGRSMLTIEVLKVGAAYRLGQVLGKANKRPSEERIRVVDKWFGQMLDRESERIVERVEVGA